MKNIDDIKTKEDARKYADKGLKEIKDRLDDGENHLKELIQTYQKDLSTLGSRYPVYFNGSEHRSSLIMILAKNIIKHKDEEIDYLEKIKELKKRVNEQK